jgi:hypothetical protein
LQNINIKIEDIPKTNCLANCKVPVKDVRNPDFNIKSNNLPTNQPSSTPQAPPAAPVAASPASFQPENAITITGERRAGI